MYESFRDKIIFEHKNDFVKIQISENNFHQNNNVEYSNWLQKC